MGVTDNGVKYGMLWFDIEGPQYWMSQEANRKFFEEMINEARKHGNSAITPLC